MAWNAARILLTADDPPAVRLSNPHGRSWFLLLGDHAGKLIPGQLGRLGLAAAELDRHIALDLGVSELGSQLSAALDAVFIEQRYSRLVVDCNRAPDSPESIARISDGTTIPGNLALTGAEQDARRAEIYAAYHGTIAQTLAARAAQAIPTVIVSLHSFTPIMAGTERPWDIGVLYDQGHTGFARRVLRELGKQAGWCIGDNQPYRMDATDYTVPRHAYPARLSYVELEVRQDHLASSEGVAGMAAMLASVLQAAFEHGDEQADRSKPPPEDRIRCSK